MPKARISDHRESSWKLFCTCISQRWLFAILAGIGLCIQNSFSVIMAITIIQMAVLPDVIARDDSGSCQSSKDFSLTNQTFDGAYHTGENALVKRYSWDEYTQGIILSSFSWSNIITQFTCGSLSERFGGKHILGFGILTQAILTFLTPFVVNWGGAISLIISRILIGFGSDGMHPVLSTMIPHWTTLSERTKIGNVVYAGIVLGIFFGTIMPALIMQYSGMGWPAVFYFFGTVGMIWFPFWHLLVYEKPEVHPFISDEEVDHFKSCSKQETMDTKLPSAPWKHILTCKEFWSFTISYIGCNWAYYLMLSELPRYMGNVVKFPLDSNGYFSSFPFLFMWLNTILSTWISDKIVEKQWMSLTKARKLLTTICAIGPATFLLLASYAECDKTIVVIMFMIGITLIGSFYTSTLMNPLDLSPNYAGSIMSAGCGIASVVAILAPYLVGVLVPNSSIGEWRLVFWMVFIFVCFSNTIYWWWFKAEVQPWNEPDFLKDKKKEVDVELKSRACRL